MYENTTPSAAPTPAAPYVPPSSPTPAVQAPATPTTRANLVPMLVVLIVALLAVLALVGFLMLRTSTTPGSTPTVTDLDSSAPLDPTLDPAQLASSQLTQSERGRATPEAPFIDASAAGSLTTQLVSTSNNFITALGPGTIVFGDYAFTTFQGQIIKIPLSCPSSCPRQLTLTLQTYTTPGQATTQQLTFPLQRNIQPASNQIVLYETDDHERLIADSVVSLLSNRRDSQALSRDSYNFGTLTDLGLYLFIDNAPSQFEDQLIDTVSLYLMKAHNSVPALLGSRFDPSASYAGRIIDGEVIEFFTETKDRPDLGYSTQNLYAYFPEQNILQVIFTDLVLLGIDGTRLVLFYPPTSISSAQIGLVSINPTLHGIKGNQVLITPENMPIDTPPDYADGTFYFVTGDLKVYASTLTSPKPQLQYDFAQNFRTQGYNLSNWWYARSNNNHPGLCLCSEDQVRKDGTGAFYDLQLQQFISTDPTCAGRASVGTWYCS